MFLDYSSRAGPAKNNVKWNWEISWLISSREPRPANQITSAIYFYEGLISLVNLYSKTLKKWFMF